MTEFDKDLVIPKWTVPPRFPCVDTPEKEMISELLQLTYRDLRILLRKKKADITGNSKQYIRAEAEYWITYDGDEEWSFRWCCNQVELDYADVRSKLRAQGLISEICWIFEDSPILSESKKSQEQA